MYFPHQTFLRSLRALSLFMRLSKDEIQRTVWDVTIIFEETRLDFKSSCI